LAYIKNLKKSFEYLVKDLSESYAPNTMEAGRNLNKTLQDSKKLYHKSGSIRNVKKQILNTSMFRDINNASRKYFKELKRGNVYKGKDQAFEEQMGLSNVNDMIYDDGEGDDIPQGGSVSVDDEQASGRTNINTSSDTNEDSGLLGKLRQNNSVKDGMDMKTPDAVIDSNEALALSLSDVMQALHIDSKIASNIHFDKLDNKMDTMNDNLETLVKFNDEIQKDFIDKTTKFYQDHMSLMTEIRSILEENVVIEENPMGQMMGGQNKNRGMMDFIREGNYKGAAQDAGYKLLNAMDPTGSFAMMASMAPTFMQEYMSNPSMILKDVTEAGLNRFLGFDVVEKLDGLFDQAKAGKNSLFNKMSLSDNKLVKMLGDALRDKGDINRGIQTGNYNKGRTFFDGVTKKAITEVIPTYLRKILSTLSGNEEMVFNYDTGQYKDVSEVAKEFYDMRPDFKGQYGRITSLVESNLDKDRVGEVDSDALEATMTKITDNLLDRSYTLDDMSVMKYNKFINMMGMSPDEISKSEYQLIRNAIMKAKSGKDQTSASEFRDIQNAMGDYNVQMSDYYAEQSQRANMTGVNTLVDGSFRSQSYGVNGMGSNGEPLAEDDKRKYKSLSQYDPTRNRKDLSEMGNNFDINMTEEDKKVLEESYDKFNTLDYINASMMGVTNLPFLDKIGVNDIKEIKEWKDNNPYDLDNIIKSGGQSIDDIHSSYMDNKLGQILTGVKDATDDFESPNINIEDEKDIEDEVTKQLSKGVSKLFSKAAGSPSSNPAVEALKSGGGSSGDDGWDLFKDYNPNVMKGLDFGAGAMGGIGIGAIASTVLTGSPFMGTMLTSLIGIGSGMMANNSKLKERLFGAKNKDKSMITNISEKFFGKERTDKIHKSIMDAYKGFKDTFLTPIGEWLKKPINWVKGKLGIGDDMTEPKSENISQTDSVNLDEIDNEVKRDDEGEEYGEGVNRVKGLYSGKSNRALFGKGIHFFSQKDGDYSSIPLSGGSTVGESGCGLLTAAMAVSNILDVEIKPDELTNIAKKYKVKNDGISFGFFRDVGYRFDISTNIFSREEVSLKALDNTISSGAMVISLYEDKSGSLHYILVRNGKQKHFAVDDPMRGKGIDIPKNLIYAKSRNFIVFYPDTASESKERDNELKNSKSIKEFFGGMFKKSGLSKKISDLDVMGSLNKLSSKVSNTTMESVLSDIQKSDTVVDMNEYKKAAGGGSVQKRNEEISESPIKKFSNKIMRKQEELLNGVAYNIEYIKRLLVGQFGDLDPSLRPDKEGVFGGVFKKRNALMLKFKNMMGNFKDQYISPITDYLGKIKENITKPFTFLKNLPSTIKDKIDGLLPSKEDIKNKWNEYTDKLKDLSETVYLYGLEFKDKLSDAAKSMKESAIEFMKDMKKRSASAWERWKEDIYPSIKESMGEFKERGKEFFTSAKEHLASGISKLWGGIKSAGKWGLDKALSVGSLFSDKAGKIKDKLFSKRVQKVYVDGGHLDAIGAVGAIDADAYNAAKDDLDKTENAQNHEGRDIDFDSSTALTVADRQQEMDISNESKRTSLLGKIKDKLGSKKGSKDEGGLIDGVLQESIAELLGGTVGGTVAGVATNAVATHGAGGILAGAGMAASGAAGAGMSVWDAIKGFIHASDMLDKDVDETTFIDKVLTGMSSVLGGTGDGVSNIVWNAVKWGLIGTAIGPGVGTIAGAVLGAGMGAVNGSRIAKFQTGVKDAIFGFGSKITTSVKEFFVGNDGEGEDAKKGIFEKMGENDGIVGAIKGGAAGGAMGGPLGLLIGAGVGAYGPGKFLKKIANPIETIGDVGGWIGDKLIGIKDAIWDSKFGSFLEAAGKTAGDVVDQFINVDEIVQGVKENVEEAKLKISDTAQSIKDGLHEKIVKPLDDNIVSPVQESFTEFKNKIVGIGDNVKSKVETAYDEFTKKVTDLGDAIYDNTIGKVKESFETIAEKLGEFKDTIVEIVTNPGDFIKKTAGGFINRYTPNWMQSAYQNTTGFFGNIGNTFSNVWGALGNFGSYYDQAEAKRGRGQTQPIMGPSGYPAAHGDGRDNFVNQKSNKFKNLMIGSKKFSNSGCAPSVLSMLLSNYGKKVPVEVLAKEAAPYTSNGGVVIDYFKHQFEKHNLEGDMYTENIPDLMNNMAEGSQSVLLTKAQNGNDHYVLVKKSGGKLMLFDPLKNNTKMISVNDKIIRDASLAYMSQPKMDPEKMFSLSDFKTRVGAGLGAGVDLLTGQKRDKIKSMVNTQRADQLNKIRSLKDRVSYGRDIEREINNTTYNNSSNSETIKDLSVDNSKVEEKLDTLIDEIKKLAGVFSTVGKEIVQNSNTNNITSNNNTNNVNAGGKDEQNLDKNKRDSFMETINKISSGVLT
jgi:hypothetical protein